MIEVSDEDEAKDQMGNWTTIALRMLDIFINRKRISFSPLINSLCGEGLTLESIQFFAISVNLIRALAQ